MLTEQSRKFRPNITNGLNYESSRNMFEIDLASENSIQESLPEHIQKIKNKYKPLKNEPVR